MVDRNVTIILFLTYVLTICTEQYAIPASVLYSHANQSIIKFSTTPHCKQYYHIQKSAYEWHCFVGWGSVFYIMLSKVLANERKCYICNVSSHWPRLCLPYIEIELWEYPPNCVIKYFDVTCAQTHVMFSQYFHISKASHLTNGIYLILYNTLWRWLMMYISTYIWGIMTDMGQISFDNYICLFFNELPFVRRLSITDRKVTLGSFVTNKCW